MIVFLLTISFEATNDPIAAANPAGASHIQQ